MGIVSPIKRKRAAAAAPPKNEAAARRLREVCADAGAEALARLGSRPTGLTAAEVGDRLKEHGRNTLARPRKHRALADILERLANPLVVQLLVICAVSFAMGDLKSTTVVGGMILLSVALSYFQERRSSRAAEALQRLVRAESVVIREGKEIEIPLAEIVPGDIVVLAAGSIIPADARILQAKDLFVSQSALTGESMPIEKIPARTEAVATGTEARASDPAPTAQAGDADPLELPNAVFQGSTVVSGAGRALVVNTGLDTFLGEISVHLTARKEDTSFDRGIRAFVWLMIRFMAIMVAAVFLIVGLTKHDWLGALLFGLAVAVGLTPEMLPMIVTVCLSKGAIAMSRKKVIVKKLKSIQNFGAIDVLCTDKTGTLTQDQVILEKYVDVTSRDSEDVLRYAYLNSYYQTGLRNLLDNAILAHEELDVEKAARKVDEIPFDFNRKRMSVVIDYESTHVLICKGAVEEIFAACDRYQIDDDVFPLIDMIKADLLEEYRDLSAEGYRVIAVAYREYPEDREVFSAADESGLILLGYLAFLDPPKDSAARAIRALRGSGVRVKILTGDNDLVTRKICRDVGLEADRIVTGRELAGLDAAGFDRTIEEADVFAHLSPMQKEAIIHRLRAAGHVVGFLGDGINDAPALKAADVGISVDTAVDVAKESADIILLEKSLLVLEDGILEGRKVFANIIKYIKMGASSNFGNMFSVVGGSYFLPFLPMAPIQVLANNLLYDISQTGIPTDNVDPEFLTKPRRWDIGFIKKFMLFIGPMSSIFDYATFFLMLYVFKCALFGKPGIPAAMSAHYERLFHTGWFVESLLTQTLIVHIIRTNKIPFFQSRASGVMTLTTLAIMAAAVVLPYSPLAPVLGLVPLPAIYWAWISGFLLAYAVLTHNVKRWFNAKFGDAS
jgi:P-type Mg2+ transporter